MSRYGRLAREAWEMGIVPMRKTPACLFDKSVPDVSAKFCREKRFPSELDLIYNVLVVPVVEIAKAREAHSCLSCGQWEFTWVRDNTTAHPLRPQQTTS